jgi:HK97 family phage portal protein
MAALDRLANQRPAGILRRIARAILNVRAEYIKLPGGVEVPRQQSGNYDQLALSPVWSAVNLLAGHLSLVPLNLYRRLPNGGRERATDHPLYNALHSEPAPGMTSYQMRETLNANIELHGVGYLMAGYSNGRYTLYPFNSLHVKPDLEKQEYRVRTADGKEATVPAENMIVFPAISLDGTNPLHVKQLRQRSMALSASYENRATAFNANGALPSGVVTWGPSYDKQDPETKKRLEAKWDELYTSVRNAGKSVFLPDGSTFREIQFNPEQMQMLNSRQFSVQEIARWFRVPPHKIGDLSRATFSNIEHQAIEYIQDSLLPRATKIETRLEISLLTEDERETLFIRHNLDGLQRGDFKTRNEAYKIGKGNGWLTTNEIRRLEDMDPVPAEDGGDTYYMPLNMTPVLIAAPATEDGEPDPADLVDDEEIQKTGLNGAQIKELKAMVADVALGVLTKEAAKNLIMISFPLLEESVIDRLLATVVEGSAVDPARDLPGSMVVRAAIAERRQYHQCRAAATTRRAVTNGYMDPFAKSMDQVLELEIPAVRKAAAEFLPGDLPKFAAFLNEYYSDDNALAQARAGLAPVVIDYVDAIEPAALDEIGAEPVEGSLTNPTESYIDNLAVRHTIASRAPLLQTASEATADPDRDALVEINETLDKWETERAPQYGRDEPIRAEGAFSKLVWQSAGVIEVMWVTFDKSCPSCMALDGKRVGITETFVNKGSTVGAGTESEITVNRQISHPQLHGGCDCGLAAVIQ